MAESAVSLLIEYWGPLLVEEVKLLKGVRGEARIIRDELESMRSFLRDADTKQEHDQGIKTWVKQVREAAYDTEDALDEFMARLAQQQHDDAHGCFGSLRKVARSIKQLKARRQIAADIRDIRTRLSNISKRKDDYNLNRVEQGSCSYISNNAVYDPRSNALFIEESELVGVDVPKRKLIDWLLSEEEPSLSTISVVGMGGLGKTTLVKKVYDSERVKKGFQTYAWVTVSQTFTEKDLLQRMTTQFYKATQQPAPSGVDAMNEVELTQMLRDHLQKKRYLLVLDDVWSVDVWNSMSNALPAEEYGSRVILTTRIREIASSSQVRSSDIIYELQPLNTEESWSLFCRRAFLLNEERSCPPQLEDLSRSFVRKCRGLPLAIVTLANLLRIKGQTYDGWELIHRGLGSELESDNNLKRMTRILMLSYNELPYNIKSCFLYLSVFPEDYPMKCVKLIRLWIAEGFVERKEGWSLEEVAESYLNVLITTNLVQVAEWKMYGKVRTCVIHDIVREIIVSRLKEEHFFASSPILNTVFSDRIRRLSIYSEGDTVPKYDSCSRLRTLLIFKADGLTSNASMITSFARLRLLRVVDLEDVPMESFPEDLASLFHLRYLSLKNTKIKKLPNSVGKLRNLETLDLKGTFVYEIPTEILNLQSLRHLLVYRDDEFDFFSPDIVPFDRIHGIKVPIGIGSLTSLQKLAYIEVGSDKFRELGNLTQLRKLGILKLRREDGNDLCTSIQKMSHLQALVVSSIDADEVLELHSLSHPPLKMTLQYLALIGCLVNVQWIASLQNLVALSLYFSRLQDDPLRALQSLPNLVQLELYKAYDGEELCCEADGYPKLRKLNISLLRGLKKMKVKKGAMSNLEDLTLCRCEELHEVPLWLQHLTNLKELTVMDMPEAFCNGLIKDEVEESLLQDFVQHIPQVSLLDTRTEMYRQFP